MLLACVLMLSGCGFSVYQLPLPGGADLGSDPVVFTASFADVLDLSPRAMVTADGIDAGTVSKVEISHEGGANVALLTIKLRRDVELPANAVARIGQTSLLGEKYVELDVPDSGASSRLMADGDHIPVERTESYAEVEETLGALSLILNGGGVAQLKTISTELNSALAGREDSARSVLHQVRILMKNLDDNKDDITQALKKVTGLSRQLRRQRTTINAAMNELPSALDSLGTQRRHLKLMMGALDKLSRTGTRVVAASKESTVRVVRRLQPVLRALAAAGDNFVEAGSEIPTLPFVSAAVGTTPETARNLHMGDYLNLDVTLRVNLADLPPIPADCSDTAKLLDSSLGLSQSQLVEMAQALTKPCDQLVSALNACSDQFQGGQLAGRCEKLLAGLPSQLLDSLPNTLGGALSRAGRPRATYGPTTGLGIHTVPVRILAEEYDSALVQLLLPGLGTPSRAG